MLACSLAHPTLDEGAVFGADCDVGHLRAIATRAGIALRCFAVLRANLLVRGTDEALARFLDDLQPHLGQPVARWVPGECLYLPPPEVLGSMIIENVGALTADDQRRLFDWLGMALGRTRIVSTAHADLFLLVQTGAFSEALYYRLNVVCVDATSPLADLDVLCALDVTVQNV